MIKNHALRKGIVFTASLVIILSVILNGCLFLVNLIPHRGVFLSRIVSAQLHMPVKIDHAYVSGFTFRPNLVLKNVTLLPDDHGTPISLKKLVIQFDLLKSIFQRHWIAHQIMVDHLVIRANISTEQSQFSDAITWLTREPRILFRDMQIQLQYQKKQIPISHANVLIENDDGMHIVSSHFLLGEKNPAEMEVRAHANHIALQNPKTQISLYVSTKKLSTQRITQYTGITLPAEGMINGQWWFQYHDQHLQAMQSVLSLSDLFVPGLFSHPFSDASVTANLFWNDRVDRQTIFVSPIQFEDLHFKGEANAKIILQKNASPKLSLVGDGILPNIADAYHYLPDKILSNALVVWLQQGLQSGQLRHIRFVWNGRLANFPFAKNDGHFEAVGDVQNTTLQFDPAWPALQEINGEIKFDDAGFRIQVNHALLDRNPVQMIKAAIPDLANPMLTVESELHTQLPDALRLLEKSPLAFRSELKMLQASGAIQTQVKLEIPLDNPSQIKNSGVIEFDNNTLTWPKTHFSISNIRGTATFQNNALRADQLEGMFLSEPIHIRIQPKQKNMLIQLNGAVDVARAKKNWQLDFPDVARGKINFSADWLLPQDGRGDSTVNLSSDLRGITFTDPPPLFYKTMDAALPAQARIMFTKNNIHLFANLGARAAVSVAWRSSDEKIKLHSVHITFGKSKTNAISDTGLWIDGTLSVLNVSQWQAWFHDSLFFKKSSIVKLPPFFKKISLFVDDAIFFEKHWKNITVQISPLSGGILLQLNNNNITGNIVLPENKKHPVQVNLKNLFWESDHAKTKSLVSELNPATIPLLSVDIQHFKIDQRADAHVQLTTMPIKNGLLIQHFLLNSPLVQIDANGRWVSVNDHTETTLVGKISSKNVGALLLEHRWSSRLQDGDMVSHFALSWPGSPENFSISQAVGRGDLLVTRGRILHLDDETQSNLLFGQLLNLLSLESITHLLTFDFSGLTKKGFVFDQFNGNFELARGVLVAHHAQMNAAVAKIDLDGKIALGNQTNDLLMTVYPKLSDSLPVLVGLAGGPLAGAAAWLVNKVVSPGVGHLMQMDYRITGTLQKPVVTKL